MGRRHGAAHSFIDPRVSDENIDVLRAADSGEVDPPELRAVCDENGTPRLPNEGEVGVGLHLVVSGAPVGHSKTIGSDERYVEVVLGNHVLRCGTHEFIGGMACVSANDDQAHLGSRNELRSNVERVGDNNDGNVQTVSQGPCDLGGRGAASDADHVTVTNEPGCGDTNGHFLTVPVGGLVSNGKFGSGRIWQRTTVRSAQQSLRVERLQVPPDRRRRDTELDGKVCDIDTPALIDAIKDLAQALSSHGRKSTICHHV